MAQSYYTYTAQGLSRSVLSTIRQAKQSDDEESPRDNLEEIRAFKHNITLTSVSTGVREVTKRLNTSSTKGLLRSKVGIFSERISTGRRLSASTCLSARKGLDEFPLIRPEARGCFQYPSYFQCSRFGRKKGIFSRTAEKTCQKPIFSRFFPLFAVQNPGVFSGGFPAVGQSFISFSHHFTK